VGLVVPNLGMAVQPISDSLPTDRAATVIGALSAVIRAEHRHAAYVGMALSLPAADTLALYHLANEPLTASQLGERLALTSGSVTALVDRLTKRKFVKRTRSEADRRVVFIELTKTGHATSWQALNGFILAVEAASAALTKTERVTVEKFLLRLGEIIDSDTDRQKTASL
jgi:DNA-binding MarR family transcriptional regulator